MEEIKNEVTMEDLDEIEEFDFEEEKETKKKGVKDVVSDLWRKGKSKVEDTIDYIKENPEEAASKAVGGLAVAGAGLLVLLGVHESNKLDRTVYSDEIGECVELKKKLKNQDKKELDYRMKTGQTKIEALDDMGMIK